LYSCKSLFKSDFKLALRFIQKIKHKIFKKTVDNYGDLRYNKLKYSEMR